MKMIDKALEKIGKPFTVAALALAGMATEGCGPPTHLVCARAPIGQPRYMHTDQGTVLVQDTYNECQRVPGPAPK